MPRSHKTLSPPTTAPALRSTIVLTSHTWRERLTQELVATAGLGQDQARLVAVRVLKGLIKGHEGAPEADGHETGGDS